MPGQWSPRILFYFFTERSERTAVCGTLLLYSLWSFFTLCTKNQQTDAASVNVSHAGICAEEVEHCLDQVREVVVVLPAPVLSCVGVVEVHRPTVGWESTEGGIVSE